ncbi:MAG: phosphoenolpyruvate--protein phosphotransferase [Thermodesulfobacteriota bacterium]|nr:phosphoenolpyruvate--protein phosphotransferase [Thermodesulfobacteriota bacterium]
MPEQNTGEIRIHGISASPGISIGKAYIVDKEGVDVVEKYLIREKQLKNETNRFKAAVKKSRDELDVIINDTPEELRQHVSILEAQKVLLKDKKLYEKTIKIIKSERVNAEWALKKAVTSIKSMFRKLPDSYLKERMEDIDHASDLIIRNLVGVKQVNIGEIYKRVILVAHNLSPAETSQIQLEKIKAFVTDRGSMASHTAIVARTLEIPAVLGLADATNIIQNDDVIIVDGMLGMVVIHPHEQTLIEFAERKIRYDEYKAAITRTGHFPAKTTDGIQLKIMGNIELHEEVVSVINYGGDGIGLLRTEFQYLSRIDFPAEDELFDNYKDVVEVMAPKPVTIRTLDINGDKVISHAPFEQEVNPALGLRGIRYCLTKTDVFITQLRAILRAAAFGHVRIMFPMISTLDEICEAKKILNETSDSLDKEGIKFNRNIEIGIMIEVPSAVIMADLMAKEVDFFSIGTNDLIQYSMAIDRENRKVAHLYRSLEPAIIRMIKHVADVAQNSNTKLFMCGEMASYPIHIPVLLGMGMDELSMNPQSIPEVKAMIRSLSVESSQQIMKDVLKQTSADGIFNLLKEFYGDILPDKEFTG